MLNNKPTRPENQQQSQERRFLELFELGRRSYVMNLFFYAVRSGCYTLASIIAHAKGNASKLYEDVPGLIDSNLEAAEDLAMFALKWESLTLGEKKKIKEERTSFYTNAYLKKQPPSEAQVKYLRGLGYKGGAANKWEASQLIDTLLNRRNKNDTTKK